MQWKRPKPPEADEIRIVKKFFLWKTLPAKDPETGEMYQETKFLEYGIVMQEADQVFRTWRNLEWSKQNEAKEKALKWRIQKLKSR